MQHHRKQTKTSEKSQRQLKVGEEIRHIISSIFLRGDFHDIDLNGVSITVSEVSISADFSSARVYVMPLGGDNAAPVLDALNRIAYDIQNQLAKRLTIRRTPKLKFILDGRFDAVSRLDAVMGKH